MNKSKSKSIDSIYEKLLGQYFEEMYHGKIQDAKAIVPYAKRTLFGEKCSDMTFDKACVVLDYIVKNICEIDEATFLSIYSTKMLRNLRIKNLTEYIIKNAPKEILELCAFEKKRILFASVWPEFYKKNFKPLRSRDIYFCKGELKGNLVKAAASRYDIVYAGDDILTEKKKDGTYKKRHSSNANVYGEVVDKILYNAMTDILDAADQSIENQLKFLGQYKEKYKKKDKPIPGIFAVIEARKCYNCALDFYMLNSPPHIQREYVDTFMAVRRANGIPANPVFDKIYEAYLMEYVPIEGEETKDAYDLDTLDEFFNNNGNVELDESLVEKAFDIETKEEEQEEQETEAEVEKN